MSRPGRVGEADSPKEPRVVWLSVLLLVVAIVVASFDIHAGSAPTPAQQANSYIKDHGAETSTVRAWAEQTMNAMSVAVNSSTTSNTSYLVGMAREAYKAIDDVRSDLA